ncbi:GNAT family N-acetyltransferase [Amycolatopsis xylanica]|nr:GNAT family N-acetyltransferase [Amycolatopsis xylanica]
MTMWTITPAPIDDIDVTLVMRDYMVEIASRYYGRPVTDDELEASLAVAPLTGLEPPTGVFLLARNNGKIAGCVGVRVVTPGLAELTKMFVQPHSRREGGGSQLLAAAEDAARALGATTIRLDTRSDLTEARAMYARHGYTETPPHNADQYAEHWFRKSLI